jgi:hypothetical protein
LLAIQGTPPDYFQTGGAANRGRLLFGYFFSAMQEKVTSHRAAPGKSKN